MNDYDRIAQAIEFIRQHQGDQPSLREIATHVAMSPSHLHEVFTRWAGISPKAFLQYLTHQNARKRLIAGQSVLQASLESGLSGPGRLHDLCVKIESATPGEIKEAGAGWTLQAGLVQSPLGPCYLARNSRGFCFLAFAADEHDSAPEDALRRTWPRANIENRPELARRWADAIFNHPPSAPLRAFVKATPFQILVWKALLVIPRGSLISYGQLAGALGKPGAARAVGRAVGSNPLAYLIPCHRVIRESGAFGEYRWGNTRKLLLLARETDPSQTQHA